MSSRVAFIHPLQKLFLIVLIYTELVFSSAQPLPFNENNNSHTRYKTPSISFSSKIVSFLFIMLALLYYDETVHTKLC
jgi:hypothetical protein